MASRDHLPQLAVREVERGPAEDGAEPLALHTDAGTIACRLHDAPVDAAAVLWVFGAGGGLGGPAGGLYPRLARQLAGDRVASLEIAYRRPGVLAACVADVLTGIGWIGALGRSRVALVGHSFGGAVVTTAGAASVAVVAVAALSSQSRGTEAADRLSPRPLFLAHGTDDEILPDRCSRDIYARAREPKRLVLYPGCRHGLDACRDELDRDLLGWLREVVVGPR